MAEKMLALRMTKIDASVSYTPGREKVLREKVILRERVSLRERGSV